METEELQRLLNEEKFPGNSAAYSELADIIGKNKIVGFVGSGASVPIYPTWGGLLNGFLTSALADGLLSMRDQPELLRQLEDDPLEVAATLEEAYGRQVFRTRLATKFRDEGRSTSTQDAIIALNLNGIVTLNYDFGLEVAYAHSRSSLPNTIRAQDHADMVRWLQGELSSNTSTTIAHLHGVPSDPDRMVITTRDYLELYSKPEIRNFIRALWHSERLLVIGFGFVDPFLTRVAESTMYDLPSDERHFAFIGRRDSSQVSAISRKTFIRKYRLRPIFYEIKYDNGKEDHSELTALLCQLETSKSQDDRGTTEMASVAAESGDAQAALLSVRAAAGAFERDLFVAPSGKVLYVDPRFYSQSESTVDHGREYPDEVILSTILTSEKSYLVSCFPEYGCTTLCRRMVRDLRASGQQAFHCSAPDLPNYKKRLESHFAGSSLKPECDAVLVLENFDPDRHERLLSELVGIKRFSRFIICSSQGAGRGSLTIDVETWPLSVEVISLAHLNRADIRTLTKAFYNSSDVTMVSSITEKVYEDLTDLCIPLTPSNVIMFLKILYRDGDFQPLNRVQIIERYISDLLKRPSDAYQDAFSLKNKVEVISSFVYHIYAERLTKATEAMWSEFCKNYMEDRLVHFDEKALLQELLNAKIFLIDGRNLFFKYRLFFDYFLGLYVAARPAVLSTFILSDEHLATPNLIEVITGVSNDNSNLIVDLAAKLRASLENLQGEYGNLPDPFKKIAWRVFETEDEVLWAPINKELAEGPENTASLDKIKSSAFAERRTENQSVVIRKFDGAEQKMVCYLRALIDALRNSDNLSATLKVDAMNLIYDAYHCLFKVGLAYASVISERTFFVWNGFLFHNEVKYNEEQLASRAHRTVLIMSKMAMAMAKAASRNVGSRKLGAVHVRLAKNKDEIDFIDLLNFACVLKSKSESWSDGANQIIKAANRDSFYLLKMLSFTTNHFKQGVNTGRERESLKRLVAAIQAKRVLKKNNPSEKLVTRTLNRLESKKAFK